MMKKLIAVLCVAALPALAQPPHKSTTKTITNTNPAGSHTMTMTKSGTGQTRTVSKTTTNTEGHNSVSKTTVAGASTHAHKRVVKHKTTTVTKVKTHKKTSY